MTKEPTFEESLKLLEERVDALSRGEHLSTLAFSEQGSRSHFWAPVSRAVSANGAARISANQPWR